VDSYGDGSDWEIVMQVTHPAGAFIRSLVIDSIQIPAEQMDAAYEFDRPDATTTMILLKLKRSNFMRFVDNYPITGVVITDPDNSSQTKTEIAASKIVFDDLSTPYLRISNATEWCEQMKTDGTAHGLTNENIEITGTLNFAPGVPNGVNAAQIENASNVSVNRIKGQPGKSSIQNLTMNFNTTGLGFIGYVNALAQDLSFENINLTQTVVGGEHTGIISECAGTVLRLDFTNIKMKMNGANYVGGIGYLRGSVRDCTLRNINIDATYTNRATYFPSQLYPATNVGQQVGSTAMYVGGLIGGAVNSSISNVGLTYDEASFGTISIVGGKPIKNGVANDWLGEYDVTLTKNPNILKARAYVGGIAGYLVGTEISECSVEYASVYSECFSTGNNLAGSQVGDTDTFAGGMIGHSNTARTGSVPYNDRLSVDHTRVINEQEYTGGIFGSGQSYSTADAPTTVSNVVVIGAGPRVGGLSGAMGSGSGHVEVSNAKIFGRSTVGGLGGTTSTNYASSSVRDSVIGSIFDNVIPSDAFWEPQFSGDFINAGGRSLPNTLRMSRTFSTYTAYNKYFGGSGGTGRAYSTSIVNCMIGGEGADYVGGGNGQSTEGQSYIGVLDTKIYGHDYIGGITGNQTKSQIGYTVSNAEIVGTGKYVGGLAGQLKPAQAVDGTSAATTNRNIFAGSVKGANYAGGLVGHVEGNLYDIMHAVTYYYADPHTNTNPDNLANNTSKSIAINIGRDNDNFFLGKVKVTGEGQSGTLYGNLLYNLDEKISANRIAPQGSRIWEYSVLSIGNNTKYAKDLMNGSAPLYKYGSKDGEYLDTTLAGRNDGRGTGPNFTEEPLYSSQNLLLTREHFLATYSPVGTKFAYSVNPAPVIDPTTGLVTNWTPENSYMRGEIAVIGNGTSLVGNTAGSATSVGGAGGIAYTRQIWRASTDTVYNTFWYDGFRSGYLPYATNGNVYSSSATGTTVAYNGAYSQAPYSEGKDAGGDYYPTVNSPFKTDGNWQPVTGVVRVTPNANFLAYTGHWAAKLYSDPLTDREYSGGIKIPMNPAGGELAAFSLQEAEQPPSATIYPVAADKISIDFSSYADGSSFSLLDAGGKELYGHPIDKPTYTFSYDFKQRLTLITANGGAMELFEIDPSALMRTVSLYADDHYHLAGAGVYAGNHEDGALIEGNFINLINGEALTIDGEVYDVSTGNVIRSVSEVVPLDEPAPLYTFDWQGTQIKTFATYSVMSTGEKQPLRLYVKDGHLAAIDPAMPIAADALILDYRDKGGDPATAPEIMTVLGDDGVIADIKDPVTLPDGFRTDFVREMTGTLSSDLTVVLVRYKSGSVAAFDYMTGELIPLQADKGEGSIIAYAKTVLSDNAKSIFAAFAGSYPALQDAEADIRSGKVPANMAGGDAAAGTNKGDGDNRGDGAGGADGADSGSGAGDGTPAGAETGGAENGEAGDSTDNTESGADAGDAAADPAGESPGEAGADADNAGDVASDAADASAGSGAAASGGGKTGGDLSRPDKAPALVSVYNMEEGGYKVYDAGSLTSVSAADPVVTLNLEEIDGTSMFESINALGGYPTGKGLLILLIIAGAIVALLVYVAVKRYRLTRVR
jgi:hypothetical protein